MMGHPQLHKRRQAKKRALEQQVSLRRTLSTHQAQPLPRTIWSTSLLPNAPTGAQFHWLIELMVMPANCMRGGWGTTERLKPFPCQRVANLFSGFLRYDDGRVNPKAGGHCLR